jgi:hypothetical protein
LPNNQQSKALSLETVRKTLDRAQADRKTTKSKALSQHETNKITNNQTKPFTIIIA